MTKNVQGSIMTHSTSQKDEMIVCTSHVERMLSDREKRSVSDFLMDIVAALERHDPLTHVSTQGWRAEANQVVFVEDFHHDTAN
jgi:hypothetical protein